MRTIYLVALLILGITPSLGIASNAGQIVTESDLAFMPEYCRGTQVIRTVSKDPKSMNDYVAIYGFTYTHLHHYCWGLNWERKAWLAKNKHDREWLLNRGVLDVEYVLQRAEPGFVLLPEIYNSQARMLFALRRDHLAKLALQNAIKAKPDYVPAYAQLSDHYVEAKNEAEAIKVLEQGIENSENAAPLIRRLEKLGKSYQGVPGSARKKAASQEVLSTNLETTADKAQHKAPDIQDPSTNEAPIKSNSENPIESEDKSNPYCRFCP
jgi:tetratricopeptide (TPR) repeat protein